MKLICNSFLRKMTRNLDITQTMRTGLQMQYISKNEKSLDSFRVTQAEQWEKTTGHKREQNKPKIRMVIYRQNIHSGKTFLVLKPQHVSCWTELSIVGDFSIE